MKELISKLLEKGYDWGYIHLFLSCRNIGLIKIGSVEMIKFFYDQEKIAIELALVEVDFLRHV